MAAHNAQPTQAAAAGEVHTSPSARVTTKISQGQIPSQSPRNLPLPPEERPGRCASSGTAASAAPSTAAVAVVVGESLFNPCAGHLAPRVESKVRPVAFCGARRRLPRRPRPHRPRHRRQVACQSKTIDTVPYFSLSCCTRRPLCDRCFLFLGCKVKGCRILNPLSKRAAPCIIFGRSSNWLSVDRQHRNRGAHEH